MKNKLLNFSKNLIITLGLVVLIFMLFATSSYAADGDSLGKIMRNTVSTWYNLILKVTLFIFAISYLVILIKFLGDRTPDKMRKAKESLVTLLTEKMMSMTYMKLHFQKLMKYL